MKLSPGAVFVVGLSLAAVAAQPSASPPAAPKGTAPASAEAKGDAPGAPAAPAADPLVERGRYIVHDVALCIQCHTPRDPKGRLIGTKLLTGARVPFDSPFPGQSWAYQAPNIRGMIGYTEAEGVRLLTDGITRGGTPPRLPMHQFHMTPEDARAVVAYLKSLR